MILMVYTMLIDLVDHFEQLSFRTFFTLRVTT